MIHRLDGVISDRYDGCEEAVSTGEITVWRDLAEAIRADGESELTLRINSYGGDVEGGVTLGVELERWAGVAGRTLTIEVEALAASAAANLIALAPAGTRVLVHRGSMVMFHSCSGLQTGGPDEMRSAALRMEALNDSVIRALRRKTSIPADEIASWFQSGAEGWLNAERCVECGLADGYADGLAEGEDDDLEVPLARLVACGEMCGKRMAFVAELKEGLMKKKNLKAEADTAECGDEKDLKAGLPEVKEGEMPDDVEAQACDEIKAEANIPADGVEENPEPANEEPIPADGETANPEENTVPDSGEIIASLRAEVESLKARVAELEALKARMTAGMRVKAEAKPAEKSFRELVAEIPANLSVNAYAKAYAKIKSEHKAEYDKYMAEHSVRHA